MSPHTFTEIQEATCPLCGLAFSRDDALCRHGCPLSEMCHLVRCPGCGYEFPLRPRGGQGGRFQRLFRLGRRHARRLEPESPTVLDLERGARARVLHLHGERARDALAVFGLVPGADFELLQKSPAFVLRVGETELALDREVASRILVEPAAAG
jgi:DtxR family Mn-dependent transcriptional regulator/ferrous iron transport protein A